jgi:chromosome segregation ATPase
MTETQPLQVHVPDRFDEVLVELGKLSKVPEEITSLKGEMRGFGVSLEALQGDVKLLAEQYGSIESKLDKHTEILNGHTEKIGELAVQMTVVEEDVKELKTDVAVLKVDVKELKEDVSVLKTDVAVLKTDVSVLKTDVGVLKQDVSVLKVDVKELKGDMKIVKNVLSIDAVV